MFRSRSSATIRRVRLEQVWRWRGPTIYLDASCLSYGFDGRPLCEVDYRQTCSVSGVAISGGGVYGRGGEVGIRHSGDELEEEKSTGTHTISIQLQSLSEQVGALYLTLSAWTTTLSEMIRPEIRCFDPDDKSAEPLARYELDGKPTGGSTAVVMACISRDSPHGRWKVTAIGEQCMGRASNYRPIHRHVQELRAKAK